MDSIPEKVTDPTRLPTLVKLLLQAAQEEDDIAHRLANAVVNGDDGAAAQLAKQILAESHTPRGACFISPAGHPKIGGSKAGASIG